MVRLLVKFKDRIIKEIALDQVRAFSIGRAPDHHLVIDNYAVSGNHAVIFKEGDHYAVKDTNSKNGTFLNGVTVQQTTLKNGDVITIGKHTLVFLDRGRPRPVSRHGGLKTTPVSGDPGPDHTMFMDTSNYRKMLMDSGDVPEVKEEPDYLLFLAGGSGRFDLTKTIVTIGRTYHCDIVMVGFFSFLAGDPAAEIRKTSLWYYLRHSGGWIRPTVNEIRIKRPVRLNHDDVIKIGPVVLKYISMKQAHSV